MMAEKRRFRLFRFCGPALGRTLVTLALLVGGPAYAQHKGVGDAPRFEVVSIRPLARNAKPFMQPDGWSAFLPGGKFRNPMVTIPELIAASYKLPRYWETIIGLPQWAKTTEFSIDAEPSPTDVQGTAGENRDRVLLMIRTMLAERFQLRVHEEIETKMIYELQLVGKVKGMQVASGPGIERPGVYSGVNAAIDNTSGRLIGNGATMGKLASALAIFLGRSVADKTGVVGYFDFDVSWSAPSAGASVGRGLGPDGVALLNSELRSHFGLRLVPAKGGVRYLVVDHVAMPSQQ